VPVVYMVFDILFARDKLTIDRPLADRRRMLEEIFASISPDAFHVGHAMVTSTQSPQGALAFEPAVVVENGPPRVVLAPKLEADSAEHLDEIFQQARD